MPGSEIPDLQGVFRFVSRLHTMSKRGMRGALADCPRCHFGMLENLHILIEQRGVEGAIYVSEVARAMRQPMPAVSRGLRMMEQDGSIVRETDPNDRRKTFVRITPQGEQARLGTLDGGHRRAGGPTERAGHMDPRAERRHKHPQNGKRRRTDQGGPDARARRQHAGRHERQRIERQHQHARGQGRAERRAGNEEGHAVRVAQELPEERHPHDQQRERGTGRCSTRLPRSRRPQRFGHRCHPGTSSQPLPIPSSKTATQAPPPSRPVRKITCQW